MLVHVAEFLLVHSIGAFDRVLCDQTTSQQNNYKTTEIPTMSLVNHCTLAYRSLVVLRKVKYTGFRSVDILVAPLLTFFRTQVNFDKYSHLSTKIITNLSFGCAKVSFCSSM